MKNRKILFRAWDTHHKLLTPIDWVSGTGNNDDRYILMEYTGYDDMNGKPIFEGDIISSPNGQHKNSVVIYSQATFWIKEYDELWEEWFTTEMWLTKYNERTEDYHLPQQMHWVANRIALEVIGNIYENPELQHQTTQQHGTESL